jgi:hypothetical protein
MLSIQVKLAENMFTPAKKGQIVNQRTDTIGEIKGTDFCWFFSPVVGRVPSRERDIDGQDVVTAAGEAASAAFFASGCM